LANRGYAVLNINPRGSIGYGEEFHRGGWRRIGHEVQRDIADGTRWAINEGIADARRIAILGEGEGGYCALMNVAQNPGLFRAAVSIDGVTDWPAQLRHLGKLNPSLLSHMKDRVGDPVADVAELKTISPIRNVDRFDAPVLAINGNGEPVPREAARAFHGALKEAKLPHEIVAKFEQADGLGMPKVRAEMFSAIEAFLAKHLVDSAK
jgi:dipeptidyl aminopeptidase/acylaminoacyl peptidase